MKDLVTLKIPAKNHKELKAAALVTGRAIPLVVGEAFEFWLAHQPEKLRKAIRAVVEVMPE